MAKPRLRVLIRWLWRFWVTLSVLMTLMVVLACLGWLLDSVDAQQVIQGTAQNRPTVNISLANMTANVFQSLLPAVTGNPRQSLTIENNNTTNDNCWVFIGSGTPAKTAAILLIPGGSYTRYFPYVPSDPVQAACASNGDTLYADYQ